MSLLHDNPEVRACFEADATNLLNGLQQCLVRLTGTEVDTSQFAVAQELAHTLRGAAALVEVEPVTAICNDLMRLFEVADTFKYSAVEQAVAIFQFALDNLDRLLTSVTYCLGNEMESAQEISSTLHATVIARWGGYFYAAGDAVDESNDARVAVSLAETTPAAAATEPAPVTAPPTEPAAVEAAPVGPVFPELHEPVPSSPALDPALADETPLVPAEAPALRSEEILPPATAADAPLSALSAPTAPAAPSDTRRSRRSRSRNRPATPAAPVDASVEDFLSNVDSQPVSEHTAEVPASTEPAPLTPSAPISENPIPLDDFLSELGDASSLETIPASSLEHDQTEFLTTAPPPEPSPAPAPAEPITSDPIPVDDFLGSVAPTPTRASEEPVALSDDLAADFLSSVETLEPADEPALAEAAAGSVAPSAPEAEAVFRIENSSVEADLLPYFYEDALTNLESLEVALHQWEHDPADAASLQAVYRHTHTIKGAANSTGLAQIGRMTHAVEDLLEDFIEKRLAPAPAVLATLLYEMADAVKQSIGELQASAALINSLRTFDAIVQKVEALRDGAPLAVPTLALVETVAPVAAEAAPSVGTPVVPAAAPARSEAPAEAGENLDQQTIRISAQRLDAVMNLIGELVINRTRLDKKIVDIKRFKDELNFCKTRLLEAVGGFQERFEYSGRRTRRSQNAGTDLNALGLASPGAPPQSAAPGDFSELEFDRYDEFNILARSLVEIGNDTSEIIGQLDWFFGSFSEESAQFNKTTTELQNEVTRIRMVPLTFLFRRLQRAARDAGQRENKEVEFLVFGGETQIDKVIVDQIYSPLLHLVRNAVSHGIEAAPARQSAGKTPRGRVSVKAFQEADRVVIELTDDGRGLNFAAIRAEAVKRGLLTADAQPTEDELTGLIFRAGFSTAGMVSENSGRGIGMDVVSDIITKLNGSVSVRTRAGAGCTFTLRLPLTLAINQAMMIRAGGLTFAVPLSFVERIVPYRAESVRVSGESELWLAQGAAVPLVRLGRLFGQQDDSGTHANVVLVRVANKSIALVVEQQLSKQDIVIKPLGTLLGNHKFFSGATLTGDGTVILILDLTGIEQALRGTIRTVARVAEPLAPARALRPVDRRTILIVDDSLSVRKVAEKYLTSLGYNTVLAVDGLDALEKLRTETVAAVLTDLEMPRMHGFELIAEIRHQPALSRLPIIVVTSRDAEKHRTRARELGANEYVTKPFTREQLAERLERLLDTAVAA